MGKLFDLDSPIVQVLNKVADLMWLNILVIICSLPIFTLGASLTAAHYVALKIKRGEEGYVSKDFFKSFKANFKQSTLIWLLAMVVIGILIGDFYIMNNVEGVEVGYWVQVLIMATGILVIFTLMWVFAVQAKFTNTLPGTLKNAFALSILQFPKTIVMVVAYCLPVVACLISMGVFPIAFLFCFSMPVYVSTLLYNKTFKGLEEKILERIKAENGEAEEEDDGEEKIFSDAPIEED